MKPAREPDDLLDAVLADATPADFRAAVLDETLRLARRRRWRRHTRRAAGAVAVACAVGCLVWWSVPRRTVATVSSVANCAVVRTQPLAAEALVSTRPWSAARWVTSVASVATISTADSGWSFRLVNDDELLALAAPRSAVLVRIGPGAQELIFVTPPDRNPAPPN